VPAVTDDFAGVVDTFIAIAAVDVIQGFHQLLGSACAFLVIKQR
jgi:hypothetical protein